ncbi:hypothetical protein Bbelb_192550 [Branchiostoma belcheri]|nr:hypothetical protein Bbelb_192550 [Branchiostoma belcheri]
MSGLSSNPTPELVVVVRGELCPIARSSSCVVSVRQGSREGGQRSDYLCTGPVTYTRGVTPEEDARFLSSFFTIRPQKRALSSPVCCVWDGVACMRYRGAREERARLRPRIETVVIEGHGLAGKLSSEVVEQKRRVVEARSKREGEEEEGKNTHRGPLAQLGKGRRRLLEASKLPAPGLIHGILFHQTTCARKNATTCPGVSDSGGVEIRCFIAANGGLLTFAIRTPGWKLGMTTYLPLGTLEGPLVLAPLMPYLQAGVHLQNIALISTRSAAFKRTRQLGLHRATGM